MADKKKRRREPKNTHRYYKQNSRLKRENRKLKKLLNVSKSIMKEMKLEMLLQSIMEKVTLVMDADRSTLFLIDESTEELWSKVAQGENLKEIRFPIGMGIAGYVAKSGDTLNIKDAYNDNRFNKEIDKKTGYRTKTILCMPIKNTSGKIIGVTQVLNKKRGTFQKSDENLLSAFSSLAAISIENAFVYEQIKKTMKTFELFVPKKFLSRIGKKGLESIKAGNAEQENVSVLFSDIREFTSISEKLSPDENLAFLNSYLQEMSHCVTKYEGFIDKFIGDAVMAIFDTEPADNAVKSAIDMKYHLLEFNKQRLKNNEMPIEIGIGINTGLTIIGTIGSNDRIDSTVIGDSVNLASRLENLNKLYKTSILISSVTYSQLKSPSDYLIRRIDKAAVKGKEKAVEIYEVFNVNPKKQIELKLSYMDSFNEALELYRIKKWGEAYNIFEELFQQNKDDYVLKVYIDRCLKYKQNPPDNWDGTIKFDFK